MAQKHAINWNQDFFIFFRIVVSEFLNFLSLPLLTGFWSERFESQSYLYNPNYPINIPCGKKPEYPEKTHDFRQRVD